MGSKRNGRGVVIALWVYKAVLSPIFQAISPTRCIYLPSCSEYAAVAVSRYGILRGSWLAFRRVIRCHPWGKGGLDPVPERGVHIDSSVCNRIGADQTDADHLP